jgi:hypothetical protein
MKAFTAHDVSKIAEFTDAPCTNISVIKSNTQRGTYTSAKELAVSKMPQVVRNKKCSKTQNEAEQSCIRLALKYLILCLYFI